MIGKILKQVYGVYTVIDEETKKIYEVKPLGKFRYLETSFVCGDNVEFTSESIIKLLDEKNRFKRPKIANVDFGIIIMSLKTPDFDQRLLDKYLVNVESNKVKPVIVITKCDLASEKELDSVKHIMEYYKNYYNVFYSDINGLKDKKTFDELLKNKISVLSGQTGAGKSHLLNTIFPGLKLKTQEISEALNRGKHTTRDTTLYYIDDKYIADSPGFSFLTFNHLDPKNLYKLFPDIKELSKECKYTGCLHIDNTDCRVKDESKVNPLFKLRYDSYVDIYKEMTGDKVQVSYNKASKRRK